MKTGISKPDCISFTISLVSIRLLPQGSSSIEQICLSCICTNVPLVHSFEQPGTSEECLRPNTYNDEEAPPYYRINCSSHVTLRANVAQTSFFNDKNHSRFCLLVQEGIDRLGQRVHLAIRMAHVLVSSIV